MSTYSKTGFKTLNYNSFRPKYPPSFFSILKNYNKSRKTYSRTLDIGCGTGIASYDLLNISKNVVGMDLSPSMIKTCNDLKSDRCKQLGIEDKSRISFMLGDFDNLPKNETFDLVTAAQCLHWAKDHPQFFAAIYEIINPGGVLAYWYYVDAIFVDFESNLPKAEKAKILQKAKDIYFKYVYDDPEYLGPHWEQPGRNILKYGFKDINKYIPRDKFVDIKINNYVADFDNYIPPGDLDLCLVKHDVGISSMEKYLSTYSSYHNYQSSKQNPTAIEDYLKELKQETGWTDNTKLTMVWNTGYTLLRKPDN